LFLPLLRAGEVPGIQVLEFGIGAARRVGELAEGEVEASAGTVVADGDVYVAGGVSGASGRGVGAC